MSRRLERDKGQVSGQGAGLGAGLRRVGLSLCRSGVVRLGSFVWLFDEVAHRVGT
jgi:hypothetical protein